MAGMLGDQNGEIMIKAKVIEDSISEEGKRITTLEVTFHRYILSEFNTHRVFSRNFSSSRAIPTKKLLEQVRTNPAMPVHWGKNQTGMQAHEELEGIALEEAKKQWRFAAIDAADNAERLANLGLHKQLVNRCVETYLYVTGIVTSTEWDNFFELRDHPDAQPEFRVLAKEMRKALNESLPNHLGWGEWHLPYVKESEKLIATNDYYDSMLWQKVSAARCCRVSYLKHDGTTPSIDEDLALFDRLAGSIPLHASPLEHQATPCNIPMDDAYSGNLKGWIQYRKLWEKEMYRETHE